MPFGWLTAQVMKMAWGAAGGYLLYSDAPWPGGPCSLSRAGCSGPEDPILRRSQELPLLSSSCRFGIPPQQPCVLRRRSELNLPLTQASAVVVSVGARNLWRGNKESVV